MKAFLLEFVYPRASKHNDYVFCETLEELKKNTSQLYRVLATDKKTGNASQISEISQAGLNSVSDWYNVYSSERVMPYVRLFKTLKDCQAIDLRFKQDFISNDKYVAQHGSAMTWQYVSPSQIIDTQILRAQRPCTWEEMQIIANRVEDQYKEYTEDKTIKDALVARISEMFKGTDDDFRSLVKSVFGRVEAHTTGPSFWFFIQDYKGKNTIDKLKKMDNIVNENYFGETTAVLPLDKYDDLVAAIMINGKNMYKNDTGLYLTLQKYLDRLVDVSYLDTIVNSQSAPGSYVMNSQTMNSDALAVVTELNSYTATLQYDTRKDEVGVFPAFLLIPATLTKLSDALTKTSTPDDFRVPPPIEIDFGMQYKIIDDTVHTAILRKEIDGYTFFGSLDEDHTKRWIPAYWIKSIVTYEPPESDTLPISNEPREPEHVPLEPMVSTAVIGVVVLGLFLFANANNID